MSLGVILIGGTILLFVLIFQKMQDKQSEEGKILASLPREYRACQDADILVPAGGFIRDMSFEGKMLRVMVDMDSDERITMLIDSCTGKVVNTLRIRVNELTSQDVTF
ncbi:MAG: hypothetical protein CMM94_01070 [Rickettsiales bacterium]|nr:hypothetical protein [Rickettsiales bacterium]